MSQFKVLIVDDSPFMRKVFSDVIDADNAFKVLATASDGQQAVDLALALKPDIITMDLEMPRMNGLEALQRIMAVQATPSSCYPRLRTTELGIRSKRFNTERSISFASLTAP